MKKSSHKYLVPEVRTRSQSNKDQDELVRILNSGQHRYCTEIATRLYNQVCDISHRFGETKLIQKFLPTQFSVDHNNTDDHHEAFRPLTGTLVKLNVYRLADSTMGFYHTGFEFCDVEYTYCYDTGICFHTPRRCHFAQLLGTIRLGHVDISQQDFQTILKDMNEKEGFSYDDYDVLHKSCNTFTATLAKKLHVEDKYPTAILQQSRLGEILAPVVHVLDIVVEASRSGPQKKIEYKNSCQKETGTCQRSNSCSILMTKTNSEPSLVQRSLGGSQLPSFFKSMLHLSVASPQTPSTPNGNNFLTVPRAASPRHFDLDILNNSSPVKSKQKANHEFSEI